MRKNNELIDRLALTVKNLDLLVQQLRETKDYSENSAITFLLKELVLEQIGQDTNNEDTRHTAHPAR